MRSCAALLLLLVLGSSMPARAGDWTPATWAGESTIQLRTTAADEGEHWFPVWLVVIDGQVYVRLGTRASGRMERNTTAPYVGVRIAGREFARVHAESAPDYVDRVAQAMAAKYWGDLLIRHMSHPLTMRLTLDADGSGR